MNIKKVISSIGVGAGAIILGFGLQYTLASWTAAPSNPPTGNVAAPINVSGGGENGTSVYAQVKTGLLTLENLAIVNLNVASGTVTTAGSVLTNDGNGNASWMVANSTGGATSTLVYIKPVVVASIPPGTTEPWTSVSLSSLGIPVTASAVILQARAVSYNGTGAEIDVTPSLSSPTYTLLYMGSSQYSSNTSGAQGIFPIVNGSFYYQVPGAFGNGGGVPNSTISVIGYIAGNGGGMQSVYVGGVTSITAGGNITVAGTGPNGTGNVTINTTATQSSGTIGGGCYYSSGTGETVYGQNVTDTYMGPPTEYSCNCPAGYSSQQIDDGYKIGNYYYPDYICLKS